MIRLPSKLTLAILTFFIGTGAVGLWYLSRIEAESQQSLSNAISSVASLKITVENPCDYPQPRHRELEAGEAVYSAECFIIQNGYTDLPPTADKSKIIPENVFPLTDEEGIKMRHDSLERKAYSYERSELYGGSWLIMFRFKQHPELVERYGKRRFETMGRAVVIDFLGKDVRIQHSNYPLTIPDAK